MRKGKGRGKGRGKVGKICGRDIRRNRPYIRRLLGNEYDVSGPGQHIRVL